MTLAETIMDTVLDGTGASQVFTYPGSPPRHLLRAVYDADVELVQTVCEQHILPMAQTRYYRQLEDGNEEVPVVVVSGEMGEAMLFQPLIAASISCPCLVIVGEGGFPHVENAVNIDHQTDRGGTPKKIAGNEHALTEHENVAERMLFQGADDLDDLEELIETIKDEHGVGIVHIPLYAHQDMDNSELEAVLTDKPDTVDTDTLAERWGAAERPLLLVGRGCRHPDTRDRIQRIADERGATIVSTLQMDGYFEEHYAGRIGIMGTPSANEAFYRCDVAVTLGASVKNTVTSFNPDNIRLFREKVIQVEECTARRSMLVGTWYDGTLTTALDVLEQSSGEPWFDEPDGLEEKRSYVPDNVAAIGDVVRDEFPDKAVNFGVGNSMLWLPYVLGPDVRKEVSRSGSMGESVAGLNREDQPLIVLGDGEFEMDLSLITEALSQDTGATIIVLNNERLGLVTEWQEREFDEIFTPKKAGMIDYAQLEQAFTGIKSVTVESPDDVAAAVRTALQDDTITIIEVPVDEYLHPALFDPMILPRLDDQS